MNGLLTAQEVAKKLNMHINTVRKYIKDGKIRAYPIGTGYGKRWRIKPEDLEAFLDGSGAGTRREQ